MYMYMYSTYNVVLEMLCKICTIYNKQGDNLSHHILDVRDQLRGWEHSNGDLYELQCGSHHLS